MPDIEKGQAEAACRDGETWIEARSNLYNSHTIMLRWSQ